MISQRLKKACALALLAGGVPALAMANGERTIKTKLIGYKEVPAVSSSGNGRFSARIDEAAGTLTYELTYRALEGNALQSHIHLGETHTNGGISVFLCTNLGNAPSAAVPTCPTPEGTVTGTIQASDVIGPNAQGIAPGEFAELIAAIRAGATYVNVHTSRVPAGEIRGQLKSPSDD